MFMPQCDKRDKCRKKTFRDGIISWKNVTIWANWHEATSVQLRSSDGTLTLLVITIACCIWCERSLRKNLSLWHSNGIPRQIAVHPSTMRFLLGCGLHQANLQQASLYWTCIFSDKHATVIECVYFCQRSTPRGYANRSPHSIVLF